jgi:DNA replication and repair protein RecF
MGGYLGEWGGGEGLAIKRWLLRTRAGERSVRLLSLHLRNFRNFEDQRLEIPPGGLALVGDNGQGKTNLLEAIYYLQIFRSFRGAPMSSWCASARSVFRVAARVDCSAGEREVTAAYDRACPGQEGHRRWTGAGTPRRRIGRARRHLLPSDVGIVAGSPSERRRYLDILLSLAVPGYLQALQRYRQVLTRRNALLRSAGPGGEVIGLESRAGERRRTSRGPRAVWVVSTQPPLPNASRAISGG